MINCRHVSGTDPDGLAKFAEKGSESQEHLAAYLK